jgi:WD40 repeat protein
MEHTGGIQSIVFSRDGRAVISVDHEGALQKWDVVTGASIGLPLRCKGTSDHDAVFYPDDSRIVSLASQTKAGVRYHVLDLHAGIIIGRLGRKVRTSSGRITFSPDGSQMLLKQGHTGEISYWDSESLQSIPPPFCDMQWNSMPAERLILDEQTGWFKFDVGNGQWRKLWWLPASYRVERDCYEFTLDGRFYGGGDNGQLLIVDWSRAWVTLKAELLRDGEGTSGAV